MVDLFELKKATFGEILSAITLKPRTARKHRNEFVQSPSWFSVGQWTTYVNISRMDKVPYTFQTFGPVSNNKQAIHRGFFGGGGGSVFIQLIAKVN